MFFLVAQADGKDHEIPFKVLPAAPSVTGTPIILNIGAGSQPVSSPHGAGLDRASSKLPLSTPKSAWPDPDGGDARDAESEARSRHRQKAPLTLHLKVRDFENPVAIDDALLVAGPRPAIALTVRQSSQEQRGCRAESGRSGCQLHGQFRN